MRLFVCLLSCLMINTFLYSQIEEKPTILHITSNYIPTKAMCQYDTLILQAHFHDTTYLHPFFRWESKMPNEAWHIEQIDTLGKCQITPLWKGKSYRCIVDDSITSEGLTFRKKASEIITPIILPFPDIALVPTKSTCLLSNGKIELFTNWDTKYLKFFWTNKIQKQHLLDAPAGVYAVVVLDSKTACRHTFSDTIHNDYVPPSLFINTRYAECGLNNGAIDLSVAGNDAPFYYKWSTGAETEDLENVGVGTYRVTVSNSVGCSTTEKMGISNIASPFRIRLNSQNASCNLPNGQINCQVEGSGAPFQYKWSTGETSDFIEKCVAGKYFIAVTNQYGCTDTAYTTVKALPPLKITLEVQEVDCYQAATGSIFARLSDSLTKYHYHWNNGNETKDLTNVPAGEYELIVKNHDGACETKAKAKIEDAPKWQVDTEIQMIKGTYLFIPKPNGGMIPYTYYWNDGQTADTVLATEAGDYWVIVTDAKGCLLTDSIHISQHTDEALYIPNFITPNTDDKNDDFYIKGENIDKIVVSIRDTLGNLVYEDSYSEIHWDASQCGDGDCKEGLYWYEALIYFNNGKVQEKKGSFLVQK